MNDTLQIYTSNFEHDMMIFPCIFERKNVLTVGNVGDSMCIISRGGKAVRILRAHRLQDASEKGRVEAAGGTVLNNRVNGILTVSRAFGDTNLKYSDSNFNYSSGPVIALPDVHSEVITPMTEFAVLATDGLYDVMEPQQIVNFVRKKLAKKVDIGSISQELCQHAINKGSVDNVTAIILAFHTTDRGLDQEESSLINI